MDGGMDGGIGGFLHCPNRCWQSAPTAPISGLIPWPPKGKRGIPGWRVSHARCGGRASTTGSGIWLQVLHPNPVGNRGSRAQHRIPVPTGPSRWGGLQAQHWRHIMAAQPSSGRRRALGHACARTCPGFSRDKAVLQQAGKTQQARAQSSFVPGSLSEGVQWLFPGWPKKYPMAGTPRAARPLPAPGKEDACCCRGWSLCFLGWHPSWERGWWQGRREGTRQAGKPGSPSRSGLLGRLGWFGGAAGPGWLLGGPEPPAQPGDGSQGLTAPTAGSWWGG